MNVIIFVFVGFIVEAFRSAQQYYIVGQRMHFMYQNEGHYPHKPIFVVVSFLLVINTQTVAILNSYEFLGSP